jgi:hypothetical protein
MAHRLNRLSDHHDRLLRLIGEARPLITPALETADLSNLRRLREEMVRALISYQLFVHGEIFAPALLSGDAAAISDAKAVKIGCIEVQRDYDVFGTRWIHRDIRENWLEYRLGAFSMMRQVEEHIAKAADLGTDWIRVKVA